MKTHIITHRGLDPDCAPYFKESSIEAFTDQLDRGYGLEFDVQITTDRQIVVTHDLSIDPTGNSFVKLPVLINLIREKGKEGAIFAIHIKHVWQNKEDIDAIVALLEGIDDEHFFIFDLKIEIAKYIKSIYPKLQLAPSIAHPYDIERYNGAVGGTLLSVEEVIANKSLFDWVWLDEWDLVGKNGTTKTFYNKETFSILRAEGFKIALVTPELHATSPGLLGGESHGDAQDDQLLNARFHEVLRLVPDAICTDYPDRIVAILESENLL